MTENGRIAGNRILNGATVIAIWWIFAVWIFWWLNAAEIWQGWPVLYKVLFYGEIAVLLYFLEIPVFDEPGDAR